MNKDKVQLNSSGRMAFFGDDTEYPMKCPRCGCEDDLSWDVVGTVYSGDARPTIYWTAWEHFDARCHECDHEATIADFVI